MARSGQVCLNKGVQIVVRAAPNERPKFLAERIYIHMMHEQEVFAFTLFVVRLPPEKLVKQHLWPDLLYCPRVR